MQDQTHSPGVYLIVEFEWPEEFDQEDAQNAAALHELTQDQDWIKEVVAASGGVGGEFSSVWIFWLKNYGALDRLFNDPQDEVSKAYVNFFSNMPKVRDQVKEKVIFLD